MLRKQSGSGKAIDRVSTQPYCRKSYTHQRRQEKGSGEQRHSVATCRLLIQNKQLVQVDTFPYLGSLITEGGERTTEFRTMLNEAGDRGIAAETMEKSQQ